MAKGKKKVGRPKAIKDPETLWGLFVAFKKHTKDNPILKHDFVGKDGDSVYRKIEKPLTVEGFACYIADHVDGINFPDIDRYLHNNCKPGQGGDFSEFVTVATRIRQAIRQDQLVGGTAGIYNSSLVAKLNHLVEKKEINNNTSVQIMNIDPLILPGEVEDTDHEQLEE